MRALQQYARGCAACRFGTLRALVMVRDRNYLDHFFRIAYMKKPAHTDGFIALQRSLDGRANDVRPRRFLRIRRTAGSAVAVVSAATCRIAELGGDIARRLSLRDDEQIEVIELSTTTTTLSDEMIGAIEAAIRPFLLGGESLPNLRRLLVRSTT